MPPGTEQEQLQRSRRRAGVLQGVYYGGGASIGHRLRRDYEAWYTGPQGLQRCAKSVRKDAARRGRPRAWFKVTLKLSQELSQRPPTLTDANDAESVKKARLLTPTDAHRRNYSPPEPKVVGSNPAWRIGK